VASQPPAATPPAAPAPASPAAVTPPAVPAEITKFIPAQTRTGWWNDRVFYEVFVRSFKDSSAGPLAGDGIGDIPGLIEKLDYLNDGDPTTTTDLGVTGLWLMPIHPSPSYHGYDVTDYYGVNPKYGTLDDFRTLITACHKRGINVILDLVLNHCSSKHPWFLEAAKPESPKHDWFIWSDTDPKWRGPWGQKVWHKKAGDPASWYYGIFSPGMPDLNFRNEAVSAEMLKVVDFWIDKEHRIGADGYRLDAIRHLIEDGQVQENTPETHAWLKQFHAECRKANPQSMSVGEVWTSSEMAATYVGRAEPELDMTFEFDLAAAMVQAARSGEAIPLVHAQAKVLRSYPANQYGSFLTNHDQTRVLTQLKGDTVAMRTAAALLLLGPGVPFIYYGEELGMVGDKPDENLRRPMRWTDGPSAGFTSGPKTWQQMGFEQPQVNVESETTDGRSLLAFYRDLIAFRNRTPAMSSGGFWPVETSNSGVYAFIREGPVGEGAGEGSGKERETILVVINLTSRTAAGVVLAAKTSPFRGKCTMGTCPLRAGAASAAAPAITAAAEGAFTGYAPVARLEGREMRMFRMGDSK
jgi:glycosidase